MNQEEKQELLLRGYEDPVLFCRVFLPHWFPEEMPWVHRGILAIVTRKTDFLLKYGELEEIAEFFSYRQDPNDEASPLVRMFQLEWDKGEIVGITLEVSRFTCIIMPRGFGKTTLINAAHIWLMLYQVKLFPFYLSETATHAQTQLMNIKHALETSEEIQAVFGELVPNQRSGYVWRNDRIDLLNGVTMGCQGRGGQVRGKNVNARRPDSILLDDVEDEESVKTAEQREKTLTWFYKAVLPAIAELDENSTITVVGTLLHAEALIAKLRHQPEWTAVVFGALLPNGEPLWPRMMNHEKLEAKKAAYARIGQLHSFYMEYLSTLRAAETQKFKPEYIHYGPAMADVINAIALDPAISDDPDACQAAIAVVGMSERGEIVIQDLWAEVGADPDLQLRMFFALAKKWKCRHHGIESIAFQASLIHTARMMMFQQHWYFEPIPITHHIRKTERIEGVLQPRYAARMIKHRVPFPELESELLDWPNGYKDKADAVAMAVTLLDPHAAFAADPEMDMGEDQYPPLEEVLGGDWRARI